MSNRQKLIPEIRFPEFKNEGEWKEVTLGYLSQIVKGEQLNRIELTETGKYPCQNGGINPSGYTDKFNTNENTITISEGGNSCGYINYMTSKFWLGGHCYKLVVNHRIDKSYLYQALKFNEEDIMRLRVGSGLPNIQQNSIRNFKFVISNFLPEQQKIASCLSSLDDLIKEHSQKLDLLKDHKKGLMQNLFPQEGEKVPKLRFKEFEEDEDWVKKRLGDLGHFLGGGTPSRSNDDYWIGNIPWISSSDIKEDDIHNISISQYINENAIIESATKIIPKGSILFVSRVGVGKLAINNEELCTSQDFTSFIPAEVLNLFVAYYYSANKNALESLSQGTSIKGFSKSDLEDSIILYPKNPKEQQKIASCLSALDELITAQAKKIERLKQHKKGLMQGLFPKTEN